MEIEIQWVIISLFATALVTWLQAKTDKNLNRQPPSLLTPYEKIFLLLLVIAAFMLHFTPAFASIPPWSKTLWLVAVAPLAINDIRTLRFVATPWYAFTLASAALAAVLAFGLLSLVQMPLAWSLGMLFAFTSFAFATPTTSVGGGDLKAFPLLAALLPSPIALFLFLALALLTLFITQKLIYVVHLIGQRGKTPQARLTPALPPFFLAAVLSQWLTMTILPI